MSARKVPVEAWPEIRKAFESGEMVSRIARRYGVSAGLIHNKASKLGWDKSARLEAAGEGLARTCNCDSVSISGDEKPKRKPPQPEPVIQVPEAGESGLSLLGDSLRSLSEAPPEEFQAAAARVAQAAVALGFRDVPPPRTISEFEKWVRLWRTFSGLDSKDSGAMAPAFQTPRSIRRASPVVDVPPDPAQGFEV